MFDVRFKKAACISHSENSCEVYNLSDVRGVASCKVPMKKQEVVKILWPMY